MKRKELAISIDKTRYRLVEAQAILSDESSGGFEDYYNHPEIVLKFHPEGVTNEYSDIVIWLKFQRNSIKSSYRDDGTDRGDMASPVFGYMDTGKRWGHSYAGKVLMDGLDEINIGQSDLSLDRKNRLRLKISGMIGKAIDEYNLRAVAKDECEQTVKALEKLGGYVCWMYRVRDRAPVDRDAKMVRDNLYANEKALTAEREKKRNEAEREAEPVVLWTTAPESYDSGTTRTLEVNGLQNKKGDPWRKVAVNPEEVEWHRGRYGSGLYECQENAPEEFQIKAAEVETAN